MPSAGSIPERKMPKRYVLTVLKNGVYEPLSTQEMDMFEQMFPDIARYWQDPQSLDAL
jgi:hypothetical protein